ncbi:MAG TPA: hypothetical protein VIJ94_08775 [Caulobacteraceae bacterium]
MFLVHTLPQQIWTALMLAVAALALWRGGWPERTIAFGMVVDSIASGILQNTRDWGAPQWADLAIDVIYLAVMIWVALRSDRWWPLWAAAFQVISIAIYVARMVDPRVGALAPFTAGVIWSYLILVVVAIGALGRRAGGANQTAGSPTIGRSST